MSKRNASQPLAPQGVEESRHRRDHYYVQALTTSIFVVRKCLSTEGEPGPDDRIVRSFNGHHDASQYAHDMNDGCVWSPSQQLLSVNTVKERDIRMSGSKAP